MPKDYYKAAIVIYTVQLLLLAVLVHSIMVEKFESFLYPRMGDSALVLGTVALLLSIGSIFIIRNLYKNSLRIQQHMLDSLKFKHVEEQNRIYHQHRHDLHNHMTVVSGLAQIGQVDKLRDYLAFYLESIDKSIISVDTGLKELDILFSAKIAEAINREIEVDFNCNANVNCSQDRIIRLTAILANALDNAIRAADNVSDTKKLEIDIAEDAVDYVFTILNTYDPEIDLEKKIGIEGFTTKFGSPRGEGVSIMRKTVRSLGGALNYQIKQGSCRLKIELSKLALEE